MFKPSLKPVVVISAPSGTGKSKVCKTLKSLYKNTYDTCVSHTTRAQSKLETNGKDYHFVSNTDFSKLKEQEYFVETTSIYDNLYGTSFASIDKIIANNKCPLLDIDTIGGYNLDKKYPRIKIFLYPPSKQELANRLLKRNRDDQSVQEKRLNAIQKEINNATGYDFFICNQDLDKTVEKVHMIVSLVWEHSFHRQHDNLMAIIS